MIDQDDTTTTSSTSTSSTNSTIARTVNSNSTTTVPPTSNNSRGRDNNDVDADLEQQRRRLILQPFDDQLSTHVIFTNPRFKEISLSTLESEDAIQNQLNFKYIDLQILRIITSSQTGANVYSSRKRNSNQQNSMKFSRLILARIHSVHFSEDNSRLVYIMEARNQNSNLWNKNVNHRDNGAISIGSIIRFSCPLPIESYMRCDIPIMTSHVPAILLKSPKRISTIPINNEIEANTSLGFVYNHTHLTINYSAPIKTSCSGKLCDRQRVCDWLGIKGCGCYGMSTNSTSLVIQHAITVETVLNGTLNMNDFSSLKFSSLYLNGDIPGSCKLYMLQLTRASMDMVSSLESCIDLINRNDGFTIVGWYKKGVINDKSLIAARNINNGGTATTTGANGNFNNSSGDVQVESGDISYHIVSIAPTKREFLNPNSTLGRELNDLKYDVSRIEN
jgi:hypothetical protein